MHSLVNRVFSIDFHDPRIPHDRVLIVEGQKFYVKTKYLSISSDYLKAVFNSVENNNNEEIELKDVPAEDFTVFLNVICPGPFRIQESHLNSLLDLSIHFAAEYVFKCCDMFVLKDFDKLDKDNLLKLACEYGVEDWKKKSLDYILKDVESFNPLEMLKIACQYKLEDLKKVSMQLLMKKLDYFNVYQTTMAFDRKADDLKKRVWRTISDNVKSLEPIQLFELAVEHKLHDDFKNKIMLSISINVENYNPIEMLKFAFKHDLDELKKKLRCFIYTSERTELFYHCDQCTDGIQRIGCKHIAAQSKPITRNSFIAQYIDEILKMPEDMKNFVIVSTTSWT